LQATWQVDLGAKPIRCSGRPPQGRARDVLVVLTSAALALWSGDKVLRGVNPFRRILGGVVLAWLVVSLVRLG